LACVAGALDLGARPKAMPAHDKPPNKQNSHLDDCAERRGRKPLGERTREEEKQGRWESNPRLPASEPALCVALLLSVEEHRCPAARGASPSGERAA
jgi:hypothetical protein